MGLAMSGAHAQRTHGAGAHVPRRATGSDGSKKAITAAVGVAAGVGAGLLAKAKIASLLLVAPIGLVSGVAAAALAWNWMRPKSKATPLVGLDAYGHDRPSAPRGLRWADNGLPGDGLEVQRCPTPLARRFERLYERRPDLRR